MSYEYPIPELHPGWELYPTHPSPAFVKYSSGDRRRRAPRPRSRYAPPPPPSPSSSLSSPPASPLEAASPTVAPPTATPAATPLSAATLPGLWGIVTDADCTRLNGQPYDPHWLRQLGVKLETILYSSSMKLDKLFRDDVLRQNDNFVITVDTMDASGVRGTSRKEMMVQGIPVPGYPDMAIPGQNPSTTPTILPRVSGVKEMIEALIANDPTIVAGRLSYASTKAISIWRAGVLIDTLYNIIKSYDVYLKEIDAWATRNKQPRRMRRPLPGSGVMWREGKFVREGEDGEWEELEDQLQISLGPRSKKTRR